MIGWGGIKKDKGNFIINQKQQNMVQPFTKNELSSDIYITEFDFIQSEPNLSLMPEKKHKAARNTGCLTGILIMLCYNPL